MKHSTDFERPIDWLAARGLTSSLTPDPDCYIELPATKMLQLGREYSKASGKERLQCLHEISRAFGFKNYDHYVDLMKRKGEYLNSNERRANKKIREKSRRWARKYADKLSPTVKEET